MAKNYHKDAQPHTVSLAKSFNAVDTLEWGPFRIERQPDQNWSNALLYVDSQPVTLPPKRMTMMALLIAQQGQPVTAEIFARELGRKASDSLEDRINLHNLLKVHLSYTRKAFVDATGEKKFGTYVRPMNPASRGSVAENGPRDSGWTGAYRLIVPAL